MEQKNAVVVYLFKNRNITVYTSHNIILLHNCLIYLENEVYSKKGLKKKNFKPNYFKQNFESYLIVAVKELIQHIPINVN